MPDQSEFSNIWKLLKKLKMNELTAFGLIFLAVLRLERWGRF